MQPDPPARRWLDHPSAAVLVGALPQLAFAAWILAPREIAFGIIAASEADIIAQVPAVLFAEHSRTALVVVPVHVAAAAAVALVPHQRRTAVWLMLGTLAGATTVFMLLAAMSLTFW